MIDSIFYFPHDKADYNAALLSPGISNRTISFVPNADGLTGTIYKNGIIYGSTDSDDSGINLQIQNAILEANNYANRKVSDAQTVINSSVNQKVQDAIASCNESADQKIELAIRQLSVGNPVDYTINVLKSTTGVVITQPGTNKRFSVDIPGADSRINDIISSQNTIINKLEDITTLDNRLTVAETGIIRLNSCCSSVQSMIDTINNRITILENRVSDLETQASIQPTTHDLLITNNTLTLGSTSGTFTIPAVTYNSDSVTLQSSYISGLPTNPAWIHDFANGGYSYDANTSTSPRYANLVITYQGLSRTLNITQSGAQQQITHTLTIANNGVLNIQSSNQYSGINIPTVSYDSNDVTSYITSSNISNLPSWITVGSSNGTLNVAENQAYQSRTASITITYNGVAATLTVNQPAAPQPLEPEPVTTHTLKLALNTRTIGAEAQTISLPQAVYDGTTTISPSNLTISLPAGLTQSGGVISIPVNNSGGTRTYTITVSYQGESDTFVITQTDHILSYDYERSTITDTFSGAYDDTEYKAIILYYDGVLFDQNYNDVTISGTAMSFLNIERMTTAISLQFLTNYGDARSGSLTFTYNGKSVSMTVSQSAADSSIRSFHDPYTADLEFRLDGNGNRGGQDPHPYLYEMCLQSAITEKAAMNVIIELKSEDNSTTYVTLNSVDVEDSNYTGAHQEGQDSGATRDSSNREIGNYEVVKRWSSSEGLVVGVHLKKWTDILDAYDNLSKVSTTVDGITINAVPMKAIFDYADTNGPRIFNLVVTDPVTHYSMTYTMKQFGTHGILFNYGRGSNGVHYVSHTGFRYEGEDQNPGRFSQNCDQVSDDSWSYGTDYFGKTSSSLALNNGMNAIERINGSTFNSTTLVSSADDNIIMVRHYEEGPDVITSTYYGDLTDASSIDWTDMTLMTRHCKSGHTPKSTVDGSSNGQNINITSSAFNYSNIDLTTTPVTRDAALRYIIDRDWMQC